MKYIKELIQVIDVLGRDYRGTKLQLKIYNDGYVEKNYFIKN